MAMLLYFTEIFVFLCLLLVHTIRCAPVSASEAISNVNEKLDMDKATARANNSYIANSKVLKNLIFAFGDELLTKEQVDSYNEANRANEGVGQTKETQSRHRRALLSKNRIWRDKVIPYVLDLKYTPNQVMMIKKAMGTLERRSCVRFEEHIFPNFPNKPFVIIAPLDGCWSTVGMNPYNIVSLVPNCFQKGVLLHELLHILGFRHEQSRADRDNFVKINWDNILPGLERNFKIRKDVESFGQDYDIQSVMHYHQKAFSKNGKPTIENRKNNCKRLGGNSLRRSDAKQINILYECPAKWYGYSRGSKS